MPENAAAALISVDDPLGKVGMYGALHALRVSLIPPLDLVEGGGFDRAGIGSRLRGQRRRREQRGRAACKE